MYRQFAFEGVIHASLDCVPMAVRRKLDLAQLKISLAGWQALPRAARLALCHMPVDGPGDLPVYVEVLRDFAARSGAELKQLPAPDLAWQSRDIPRDVATRSGEAAIPLDAAVWARLDEDARYALVKLADPKREATKFIAAAVEFGLCERPVPAGLPSAACGVPASAL
jgi:hypothetical protein